MSDVVKRVLWREGLFLRPHHLQQMSRGLAALAARRTHHAQPFAWGVASIEIDPLKLEEGVFEVRGLELALPDGEIVQFHGTAPSNALVESRPIPQTNESGLTVYAAVRRVREQEANVGEPGEDGFDPPRYVRANAQVADLTTGRNLVDVEYERLNVRIFFEGERTEGFELVPIARLVPPAVGLPLTRLCPTHAPPSLRVDACPALHAAVKEVYGEAASKAAELAAAATASDVVAGHATEAELMQVLKLYTLRGALPLLREAADGGHVHPYELYLQLAALLGQFTSLSEGVALANVPRYDHGNVGGCYRAVLDAVTALFRSDRLALNFKRIELSRIKLPFGGLGVGARELDPEWLGGRNLFFLVFTNPDPAGRELDWYRSGHMKVASFARITNTVTQRKYGVQCTPCPKPRALPARSGAVYYQLETHNPSRPEMRAEWQAIQNERTLVAHFATEGLAPGGTAPDLGIEAYVVFGR